jgi:hypothetical protein
VKGLTNATVYRFWVGAVNIKGEGPQSSSEEIIPLNGVGDVLVIGRQKTRKDGSLALSVYVTGPGAVSAKQLPAAKSPTRRAKKASVGKAEDSSVRAKSKPRVAAQPTLVLAARADARGAGIVTLLLKPTRSALRALRAGRRVKVPLLLTFSSAGGVASAQQTTVELGGEGRPSSFPATGPPRPSQRYSFENDLAGWESAWGDLTLANSASEKFSDAQTLQITIHANPLSAINATYKSSSTALSTLKLGSAIYMWVYRPASTPSSVSVVPMVREGTGWTFCPGPAVKPPASMWYEISMTVANCTGSATASGSAIASELEVDAVGVQIDDPGGAASGKSIYLDQVSW